MFCSTKATVISAMPRRQRNPKTSDAVTAYLALSLGALKIQIQMELSPPGPEDALAMMWTPFLS